MDPWLEHPAIWPDVHNGLIAAIRDELAARVAPRYYLSLRQRSYRLEPGELVFVAHSDADLSTPAADDAADVPGGAVDAAVAVLDVEVATDDKLEEWFLEVHDVATDRLVTVLEVLSSVNKIQTRGREGYIWRRGRVFLSQTNLVEIDLLRDGEPMPLRSSPKRSDYRILISRGATRPKAKLFTFNLRLPIPAIPIPLMPGDAEPELALGAVLHALYNRARFDLRLNYAKSPVPPLKERDAEWAQAVVRSTSSNQRD